MDPAQATVVAAVVGFLAVALQVVSVVVLGLLQRGWARTAERAQDDFKREIEELRKQHEHDMGELREIHDKHLQRVEHAHQRSLEDYRSDLTMVRCMREGVARLRLEALTSVMNELEGFHRLISSGYSAKGSAERIRDAAIEGLLKVSRLAALDPTSAGLHSVHVQRWTRAMMKLADKLSGNSREGLDDLTGEVIAESQAMQLVLARVLLAWDAGEQLTDEEIKEVEEKIAEMLDATMRGADAPPRAPSGEG